MVQKLRYLWGRIDIRILVLLVCGFVLAGLVIAFAQLAQPFSDDPPLVSSWNDLVERYLDFRAQNDILVVPAWFMAYGQTEALLKEFGIEALQNDPDWYWNFDGGTYLFSADSPLAKQVEHGVRIIIYEDMVTEELIVLSTEGEECREEVVYRAPKWPALKKDENYDQYLRRELSERRIVWEVTLKSKALAGQDINTSLSRLETPAEGGGMMLLGMEEASNHLWLAIDTAAQGLGPDEMQLTIHWPEGFTNRLEIYSFDPDETNTFNGLGNVWQLATTNLATEGESELTWTDEGQMDRVSVADCTSRYYAVGNMDLDVDADGLNDSRELFVIKTSAMSADTDGDGAIDGDEVEHGTSPLINPGDTDGDGLSDHLEVVLGTDPDDTDTDEDWVSDGYEYEQATDPLDSEIAPILWMEVEGGEFYARSTNLQVRIQGLVADQLALAEVPTMENSVTNPFGELVYFGLNNETNGNHCVSASAVRGGTNTLFIGTASIILDTMPPFLSVTNPSSGLVTADRWVAIEGLATDEVSSVCVKLNGKWADGVSIGRFWKSRYTLNPGTNLVDITGSDAAGNCVTQTLSIVQDLSLDTNAPVMSLDLPSDFTVQAGLTNWNYGIATFGDETNLAFRGSIDDRTAVVNLRVESRLGTNGPYAAAVGSETQVWGELMLFEGSNRLVATASDAAGNSSMCEWAVIRNTSFVFRITSPLPWAVVNGDSTYVTCIASPEFSNAVVTVNGQSASIVPGSNLTFRTDAVVPLGNGVTKISACAILNGQSYYADPAVTTYKVTRWRCEEYRDSSLKGRFDNGENYDCEIQRYSDGVAWDKDSKMEAHCSTYYSWTKTWDGTETEYMDDYCTTNWTANCPNGSTAFGLQQLRYSDYEAIGFSGVAQDGELNIIDDSMINDKELVYLQFPRLNYGRLPNESIDPAKIKFRGQPGFWYNSNVTFIAEIERNTEYSIMALNFDWPTYTYTEAGFSYGSPYLPWMRESSGHWLTIGSVVMDVLKVEIENSSTENFSPQLGEDATINVKLSPTPPTGGFPDMYFECEIVRALQGGSDQHIQWIDVDPSVSGIDLAREADFSTLALTWNGVPDPSLDGNASQATGPESFSGVSGSFNRILPAVTAGQCVPPPLYYAVARLKKASDNSTLCEARKAIYVPQVVTVTCATDAINELMTPIVDGATTVVTAFASLDVDNMKASVAADVAAYYGGGVNIRFGAFSSVSAPYGTMSYELGNAGSPDGSAPQDFGNAVCAQTAQAFVYRHRLDCWQEYVTDPSFSIPVAPSELSKFLGLTTTHEIGHTLGLVEANAVLGGTSGSHNKSPWTARQIMNPGLTSDNVAAHLGRTGSWSFKALNHSYVEFVLPKP